jgi:hypothetical protein
VYPSKVGQIALLSFFITAILVCSNPTSIAAVIDASGASANVAGIQFNFNVNFNIEKIAEFNFGGAQNTLQVLDGPAPAVPNTFRMQYTGTQTRAQFFYVGQRITDLDKRIYLINDSTGELKPNFPFANVFIPWWTLSFNLELEPGIISIRSGRILHNLAPHDGDGPGQIIPFGNDLTINAAQVQANQLVHARLAPLPGRGHGPHNDQITMAHLWGAADGEGKFHTWNFEFGVEHVPEPGSFVIMGFLGLSGLASRTFKRRKIYI